MKKLLEVSVFCTLVVSLVAAAEHAGRLEAREELEKTKKEVLTARAEAKAAKAWADIVEVEAAELVARSRNEQKSQTNP